MVANIALVQLKIPPIATNTTVPSMVNGQPGVHGKNAASHVEADTHGEHVRVHNHNMVETSATAENTTARDATPTNALLMVNGAPGVATDLAQNHAEVVTRKPSDPAPIHHLSSVDASNVQALNDDDVNATQPSPTHVQLMVITNHGVNGPNVATHVEVASRLEPVCAFHHNMEEKNAQLLEDQQMNKSAINSYARDRT